MTFFLPAYLQIASSQLARPQGQPARPQDQQARLDGHGMEGWKIPYPAQLPKGRFRYVDKWKQGKGIAFDFLVPNIVERFSTDKRWR